MMHFGRSTSYYPKTTQLPNSQYQLPNSRQYHNHHGTRFNNPGTGTTRHHQSHEPPNANTNPAIQNCNQHTCNRTNKREQVRKRPYSQWRRDHGPQPPPRRRRPPPPPPAAECGGRRRRSSPPQAPPPSSPQPTSSPSSTDVFLARVGGEGEDDGFREMGPLVFFGAQMPRHPTYRNGRAKIGLSSETGRRRERTSCAWKNQRYGRGGGL